MNILLITPTFPPEIGSSSQIYYDLAYGFKEKGHQVGILTSYPRDYNLPTGVIVNKIPTEEIVSGITIYRVKHPAPSVGNIIMRGLEHFYMPFYYFKRYKRMCNTSNIKYDVCIIHSPPLPFYYLSKLIKKYDGTPCIINYQDFHPGELIAGGMVKNKVWIKILEQIEHQAYSKADYITSHTEGGVEYMIARGANPKRIEPIYNIVDLSIVDDEQVVGDYKLHENIQDKFLITYAGRILPEGGFEKILAVAKELEGNTNIIIYIIGNGPHKRRVEELVSKHHLNNIVIRDFVPRNEYLNIIKSSDLVIVSLNKTDELPCFPGKLLNLMALKKPIIGFLSENGESARVIKMARAGIIFSSNDIKVIAKEIQELLSKPDVCSKLGENGRAFVEKNMTPNIAVSKYEKIIMKLNN